MSRGTSGSEFRLVLTKLNEVQEKLDKSDQSALANSLSEINDSLRIIEGNHTDFSDAAFQTLQRLQTTIESGFKAMEERIVALEGRVARSAVEEGSSEPLTPPSSSRKRKISRHPDLSVSYSNFSVSACFNSLYSFDLVFMTCAEI